MLKESLEEDDERLTDVTEIVDATERAKALTKQLLAFSRHQRMEVSALNVNTVIKDIYKMLSRLIGENIVLELMLQEELRKESLEILCEFQLWIPVQE
jgi:signal transduction histidine kinase